MLPSSSGEDTRFSAGRRGFESRWQYHIHLPVAQPDEQRATNAKVCRFESCREGQLPVRSSAVGHSVVAGERAFNRAHRQSPSRAGRSARRRTLTPFRQVRFLCAQPFGPVAKQERGGLQNRHEPGQHRPGLPSMRSWTNWTVSRPLIGPMLVRIQSSARHHH